MKNASFLATIVFSTFALSACQNTIPEERSVLVDVQDTSPVPSVEIFEIGSQYKDCVGVVPQKCLVVNGEYFYDDIVGFDFEPGYEYKIKIKKDFAFGEDPESVPADASYYRYELIEILSKSSV